MADEPTLTTGLTLPQALQILGRYKAKLKEQSTTIAEMRKGEAALRKEFDDLKKADHPARVKELEGQLRTLTHRTAFERLAKDAGAKGKALDTLFRESGYKAEGDAPDEKAMKAALERLRESHDFAFDPEGGGGDGGGERPASKAQESLPDAGRGKRGDGKGTVYITREQLADPKWALDPKNAELRKTAKVRD